jgi:hypothetical protein
MISRSIGIKVIACFAILSIINATTCGLCFGQESASDQEADTTRVEITPIIKPEAEFPFGARSDSLMNWQFTEREDSGTKPIYTTWWFWTICTAVIATVAVILAGGDEEAPVPMTDLPDFPAPPGRD